MNIKFYNEILHDRLQAHHKVTVAKIATEAEHRNAESEGLFFLVRSTSLFLQRV